MKDTYNDLEALYFQVTDLWRRMCEEHSKLLDLTFDEYALLLESKVEELEEKVLEKQNVIAEINVLEKVRHQLIDQVNAAISDQEINSISALLKTMNDFEEQSGKKHLFRFNALLIDIIEKIQDQNKRNQLFINKAIHSCKRFVKRHSAKSPIQPITIGAPLPNE